MSAHACAVSSACFTACPLPRLVPPRRSRVLARFWVDAICRGGPCWTSCSPRIHGGHTVPARFSQVNLPSNTATGPNQHLYPRDFSPCGRPCRDCTVTCLWPLPPLLSSLSSPSSPLPHHTHHPPTGTPRIWRMGPVLCARVLPANLENESFLSRWYSSDGPACGNCRAVFGNVACL